MAKEILLAPIPKRTSVINSPEKNSNGILDEEVERALRKRLAEVKLFFEEETGLKEEYEGKICKKFKKLEKFSIEI